MNATGPVTTPIAVSKRRDSHSDHEDAFEAAPDYHRTIAQALAEALEKGLEFQDENVTDGNFCLYFYFIVVIIIVIFLITFLAHLRTTIKEFCDLICRGISTCG